MRNQKRLLAVGLISSAVAPIYAQDQQAEPQAVEEVVVTGIRGALASGIETKRESFVQVDEINAEDIAEFPDSNLAEAIQRLPGVSIDRNNGEGNRITVRGLGGDFTTTTLNGMDVLATSGGGNSGSTPNRGRSFDFNTFASELFSSLSVQKTASAATDEGSLGATVGLKTGRPLETPGTQLGFSAEGAFYEAGENVSPRLAGLVSKTFFDDKLGIMFSTAYSERSSIIDKYERNSGQADLLYRNSALAGITPLTYGFARPSNATNATPALSCVTNPTQVGCGSDPTAYAALPATSFIPTFPTLSHNELDYERLGMTFTAQWAPTDNSKLTFDVLKSSYDATETLYELHPISTNRNLYNAVAASNPGSLSVAGRRALYPLCALIPGGLSPQDCGQSLNGNTPIAGTVASFNPNNFEAYDYYNSPVSVGYVAHPNGIGRWAELVGRPNMQVRDVNVVQNSEGQSFVDYIVLDNVDWRNTADGTDTRNDFQQISLSFEHSFTDRFRMDALAGVSESNLWLRGMLIEFNNLDKDGFVFDGRGGGAMPVVQVGFDPTDPGEWDIVKGLTNVRNVIWEVDTGYRVAKLNFDFQLNDVFALNWGFAHKEFENKSRERRRNTALEVQVPTQQEADRPITDFGSYIGFGDSIDVSAGTPTGWFAPSFDAWRSIYDVECNCINEWGDWRLQERVNNTTYIDEYDNSAFLELNFKGTLFDRELFGNVGARYAKTEVHAAGQITGAGGGRVIEAQNEYDDFLPSLNLAYEVLPDTLIRVAYAKVMARPQLATLRPNGNLPASCAGTAAGCNNPPAFTMGNPFVDPFRATNYDLSFEWYFAENEGLLAAAVFYKDIDSFPQDVRSEGQLSEYIEGSFLDNYVAGIVDAPLLAHIAAGGNFTVTQPRDAPGGYIKGVELSYQQPFTFLPAPFDNFGVIANYTRIESELEYIVNNVTGATEKAPYLNASPNAFNATLYYQAESWEARLSGSFRSEYMQLFPVASGTCEIGLTTNAGGPCNAPVLNDFRAVRDNLYVDASFKYQINDHFSIGAEVQNLTDEKTERWIYQDVELSQQYLGAGRIFSLGVRMKL
jgi:iron complex outermembrane receptor protein